MPYKYFQKLILCHTSTFKNCFYAIQVVGKIDFSFLFVCFRGKHKEKVRFLETQPRKPPRTLVEVVVKVEGEANVALGLVAVEHDVGLRQGEVGEE